MYQPKYTITNKILKYVGAIEGSREVIDNAPLVPAWEARFREEAVIRTVHFGTHLEGNELSFTEAKDVLAGREVIGRDRDVQEVLNYREVLKYIDGLGERAKGAEFEYTQKMVKKIHRLTTKKILPPERCGHYRKTQVVIRNSETGEIVYKPPPAVEVPYLMDSFVRWLNSEEGREAIPILRAGITHYVLAAIHPFVEGNGRTARAFATAILFAEGYNIKKFFSLEEYFDKNSSNYYEALARVSDQDKDINNRELTGWLEFFAEALAAELSRIKEKVRKLSVDLKLKRKVGKQISLTERQMKMMELLEETGEMRMMDAKKLVPMVSEDTLLRDLKDLMKKGIVRKKGSTKAAKYVMG
jgi:Fic family protein